MKKNTGKIYNESKQEIFIKTFGLMLFGMSAAYLVTYIIQVG
jgi:hypothetical protein